MAYIFEFSNNKWQQTALLEGGYDDFFGWSVDMYDIDNTYAIIGAYKEDTMGTNAGVAYIYEKNSTTSRWFYVESLYGDAETDDYFGYSVTICNDYAIIGATKDDEGATNAGAAYVFEKTITNNDGSISTTWNQTQKLVSPYPNSGALFGYSLSLNCDSDNYYVVIGAQKDDSSVSGGGAAYIFELETINGEEYWNETAQLITDQYANDALGTSVSASENCVILGDPYHDDLTTNAGASFIVCGILSGIIPSPTIAPSDVTPSPTAPTVSPTGSPTQESVTCDDSKGCCANDDIAGNEVYCRAYDACRNSTITVRDNCYCSGDKGCYGSRIRSRRGDIYCSGDSGCFNGDIIGRNGDVKCSGDNACQLASISGVNVECNGYSSCNESTISATNETVCSGYGACKGSSVSDTHVIFATGEGAFEDAEISSDGVSDLTIYSDGVSPLNNAQLYCYTGSNCTVICGSGTSCTGLIYYCDTSDSGASCTLDCDNDCSDCPQIENVDLSSSSSTSFAINNNNNNKKKNKNNNGINSVMIVAIFEALLIFYFCGATIVKKCGDKDVNYKYSLIPDP